MKVYVVVEAERFEDAPNERVLSIHKTRKGALKACKDVRHTRVDEHEVKP